MLFETQAKADNFIRYNGDDILEESGKAPVIVRFVAGIM